MFLHQIAQYVKFFIAIQGSNGVSPEKIASFLSRELPNFPTTNDTEKISRCLFEFFKKYPGFTNIDGQIYASLEWSADILGIKNTRLSEDGHFVFLTIAASFSHGILTSEICMKTKFSSQQICRFVKILVADRLVYDLSVTLSGAIKKYWRTNSTNVVWATIFLNGRTDEELYDSFIEYTRSLSDFKSDKSSDNADTLTPMAVCKYLVSAGKEQTYEEILNHFTRGPDIKSYKARAPIISRIDSITVALDKAGVLGSYVKLDDTVVYSRFFTPQGLEFRPLSAVRRENKGSQHVFHMGTTSPITAGPDFLFFAAVQILTSAHHMLPSITPYPINGVSYLEADILIPLTYGDRVLSVIEMLIFKIFQSGEEGFQLITMKDQYGLSQKFTAWIPDFLSSFSPIVRSGEARSFKYWHFPYGPKALYVPLLEPSVKTSSRSKGRLPSFEEKVRHSYARIAQFLSYDRSAPDNLESSHTVPTCDSSVHDMNQDNPSTPNCTTPRSPAMPFACNKSGVLVMTPLGCFFSDALEYSFIQYDTHRNVSASAKSQFILCFFKTVPLYIQQDLFQLASSIPTTVYASFPNVYGFKDLPNRKSDKRNIQRGMNNLLKMGYILEATVPIGTKKYTVYYRPDIFVLDKSYSPTSHASGFLQNMPNLLDYLKTYLSTLPSLSGCDETEGCANFEEDHVDDTVDHSANSSSSSEPPAVSWATYCMPKLTNYEEAYIHLSNLNRNTTQPNAKVIVLAESTRNSQSIDQFTTYTSTYSEALASIKADITQSRRKNNLRRLMLLHTVFLQISNAEAQTVISDISLCDALTFAEYTYLFPPPESSPLYQLLLSYLLPFPNTPICKMNNPALYTLVLNSLFAMRMGKYREWLKHIDILHWSIEQLDTRTKNYIHKNISFLPPLKLNDLKNHHITMKNVLSAIYSSLYVSGITAMIKIDHEADTINIKLLEPISVSTKQELVLFWSFLEDFSLRMYIALKFITEDSPISISCLCNELATYTLIRSWIFNSEVQMFLKERLGDLDFVPTLQLSMSQAQKAAISLCDTLGQHGTIVHINAFMGALQKEIKNFMEMNDHSDINNKLQRPITNLLIIDYYKLATIAVNDLPQKYLDLHFDGSLDNALEYYRFSQQSTLDFIMHSMRISSIAFCDSLDQSEPNDCNLQHCVYIPDIFLSVESMDENISIQCIPDNVCKIYKVQLCQVLVARASATISYWVDKILLDTRPRGGTSSSLSINMQPTDNRGTEYCSVSLFTNNPWLLSVNIESVTAEQIAKIPIFQKHDRNIQRMRAARSSRLTPALQKQRSKQKQEQHLREELALILSEDAGPESESRPVGQTHPLTIEDLVEMVAQYKLSRRYINTNDSESRYLEHCMMHYMSLFRVISPWMHGYVSNGQINNQESNTKILLQEHCIDSLTALAERYVVENSTRRDFIAYGRIYSMAALSLLSPEIDVLINLPSSKERSQFLKIFSNTVTSIARNTYKEKQLSDPSETVRLANLLYLLTNKIEKQPSKQLQTKLLVGKDLLINLMNPESLKLNFDCKGVADPDSITYIYENSFPDIWPSGLLSLCNDIARHSSACPALCYDCPSFVETEQQLVFLLQCILSCHIHHYTNPIIKYSTEQGILKACYSTHRLLLRRTDYIEKQMLYRNGDSVQSLLNFFGLPSLLNAIIHSTNIFFTHVDSTTILKYKSLWSIVCEIRNRSILQQHLWAGEIRMYMARNLWSQPPVIAPAAKSVPRINDLIASDNISAFSLQYLLASGYTRQQTYGPSGYSVSKTLQKQNLISADSRSHYLSSIDMAAMTVHNAFLLLPSIIFGLHRQRYKITGSTMERLKIVDPYSAIDLELDEEDTLFNPMGDILDTYAGLNDAVSAMIGDAIKISQKTGSELICPMINLTEDCNTTQKQDIDTLLQNYNDSNLCLTLFNYPEHKNTLLGSGLFVPKRLLTETVFVPLDTFLANPNCDQFATEFCAATPTACSIDYAVGNKQEAEVSLRQMISLISLYPGITLERLCTACVPLPPTTVCYLLNVLIWDEVVEARRLISLADGYSAQQIVLDILTVEPTEFSRVFLSTNAEHLADGIYNSSRA